MKSEDKSFWTALSKLGTLSAICGLLVFQAIHKPPSPLNFRFADLSLLLLLSVLLPYPITVLQSLMGYKRFADKRIIEKVKSLCGLKRLWVLHKNSKRVGFFSRGTPFSPIILIKGDVSTLKEEELLAALCHEVQHNRLWHFPLSFLVLTTLIYLLKPYGLPGFFLALFTSRALSIRFEFDADRFAARMVSKEALFSAIYKLEKPLPIWVDLVPVLNLLFTHPSIEERVKSIN